MKNRYSFTLIGIYLLTALTTVPAALAQGGVGSHGGTGVAISFTQWLEYVKQQIDQIPEEKFGTLSRPLTKAKFAAALKETLVTATDEKLYHTYSAREKAANPGITETKVEVDAVNFSEQSPPLIKVNNDRWKNNLERPGLAGAMIMRDVALHEGLGIVNGLFPGSGEWDEYSLSVEILNILTSLENDHLRVNTQWIDRFKTAFEDASHPKAWDRLKTGFNYSCVQYSGMSPQLPAVALQNEYLFLPQETLLHSEYSELNQKISFNRVMDNGKHPEGVEHIRVNEKGDLLIEQFLNDDPEFKEPVSYRYCPRLESETLYNLRQFTEAILLNFKPFPHKAFKKFKKEAHKKILDFKDTPSYQYLLNYDKLPKEKQNPIVFMLVFFQSIEELAELDLGTPSNPKFAAQQKANLEQVQSWINSLGDEKERLIAPIQHLMEYNSKELSYNYSIIGKGDSHMKDSNDFKSLNDMFDAFEKAGPPNLESSKLKIKAKSDEEAHLWITGFTP